MRAPRRADPAHAVRQARGRKPDLGVAKGETDLAEDGIRGEAQPVDHQFDMAAGEARIDRVEHALDPDRRLRQSAMNMVARPSISPPSTFAMMMAKRAPSMPGDQPFAAVDDPFVAFAPGGGLQKRRVGACAAGLGHDEAGAVAARQRREVALSLVRSRHDVQEMHVAFVGRRAVKRDRPEQRIAGRLEDDGLRHMPQSVPAIRLRRLRREDARGAGQVVELEPKRIGRTMRRPARACS